MTDRVEVDPDLLRRAARTTEGVHDRIKALRVRLASSTAALGEPWGDDKIGTTFEQGPPGYAESRDSALGALDGVATTLAQIRDVENDSADYLAAQERANESMFR
ncbi:WXG100 family type VII secretion target [Nocardia puris]|nr:hypothetical protein [Nocardia puris]